MRRRHLLGLAAAALMTPTLPARATAGRTVLPQWYRLVLELVRHTATYSPPVAARAFAYLGIIAWEVTAAQRGGNSLAGQVPDLAPVPPVPAGMDAESVMHGALAPAVAVLFGNTGPTGQRAMAAMTRKLGEGRDPAAMEHGAAIAAHVLAWAEGDGGARVENLGFPMEHTLGGRPESWVPTSTVQLQQTPLLPAWGNNRPFAMPSGTACRLPPPPAYSEEAGSAFHAEAMEVYEVSQSLTEEQKIIARFWSDDPMLSPTPPGHWITILLDIAARDAMPDDRLAALLARLGMAMSDAFIACWQSKYEFDLLRPVTYIRRVIDPKWEPLLITPPFPEYPSGHSTQSGAAAAVLTAALGEGFAFIDTTHEDDGLPARSFQGFHEAAREAAMSRLYGGIHFRAAIDRGLEQGACVGGHVNALRLD